MFKWLLLGLLVSTPALAEAECQYTYEAVVEHVVDGDTVDVEVDLGFGVMTVQRLRILHLDTPETYAPKSEGELLHGKAATERAEELLAQGRVVMIKTEKDKKGKFGRYLAQIRFLDGTDYATIMKNEGYEKRGAY